MEDILVRRARRFAALGEPVRLAIVDALVQSDRSPGELAQHVEVSTNLLSHHLGVLEEAGLIERFVSSGDRRRRYVRLLGAPPPEARPSVPAGPVLFVCTHNSARSQMAAALWRRVTGGEATSAGTHPAERIHPGAVAAAGRVGIDLGGVLPRRLDTGEVERADVVVTVCDRAHEELVPTESWWHWSVADPVVAPSAAAFDLALGRLRGRIESIAAPHAASKLVAGNVFDDGGTDDRAR